MRRKHGGIMCGDVLQEIEDRSSIVLTTMYMLQFTLQHKEFGPVDSDGRRMD